ncbi:MAG: DUF3622 domain-containing protein [Rhodocyclaceae bacterium]|nr:DUF3622 domain-containing protein [Rhodocyclaceae bacterium]
METVERKFGTDVIWTGDGYVGRVLRRRTAKGTTIERVSPEFSSADQAEIWSDQALNEFLSGWFARRLRKRLARNSVRLEHDLAPNYV